MAYGGTHGRYQGSERAWLLCTTNSPCAAAGGGIAMCRLSLLGGTVV